jgi:hypothetical protein
VVVASVTSAQNITAAYTHQYQVTFGYGVTDGSTISSGTQIGNYTAFGSIQSINAGATLGSTSPTNAWVDAGANNLNYTTVTSGFERWSLSSYPNIYN